MKHFANKSVVLAILLTAGMGAAVAQTASVPALDVVTIKPAAPDQKGGMLGTNDDKFVAHNQPLIAVLKMAYNMNMGSNDQILGVPEWVKTERFDMDGKEPVEVLEAWKTMKPDDKFQQVRLQIQRMLEERFKLKMHHETKEIPVYALTVAKGGVKMKPADPAKTAGGWSGLQGREIGQLEGRGASTGMLCNVLARQPEVGGKLVLDKTGRTALTDRYDFVLKWTPDMNNADPGGPAPADTSGPSLFTALQEELGLRLESTKAPVDVIVVDSVERPSEN